MCGEHGGRVRGLGVVSAALSGFAADLTLASAPDASGSPGQTPVDAVKAAHAEVDRAASAMAARMLSTGEKLSTGAARYRSQDGASADTIDTVGANFTA